MADDRHGPAQWFAANPRAVLPLDGFTPSHSLRQRVRRGEYEIRYDTAFERVIRACAEVARPDAAGTWITPDMIDAYCGLHALGFAHCVEAWEGDELVGGIYGVALGAYFSGESMFHTRSGASIAALVALVVQLRAWGFKLFDCQTYSRHVERLGARRWPRRPVC